MKQTIEIDVPEGMEITKIRDHSIKGWLTIQIEPIKPRKFMLVEQYTNKIENGMYWTDKDNPIPKLWQSAPYTFHTDYYPATIIWKLEEV